MNTPSQSPVSVREQCEQPAIAVRIDSAKLYQKKTLVGFLDFTLLDTGLSVKGAGVHEREGQRWLSLPSRSYSNAEGTQWVPVIEFASKEAKDRITSAVLAAFDAFSATGSN